MSELAMCPVCGDVHNEAHIAMHRSLRAGQGAEERIRIANETGVIKFSSGRTMEPNAGIVGLSPELEVYEGFDSAVLDCPNDPPLPNDLSELADIMIDRWQRFKASLGEKA